MNTLLMILALLALLVLVIALMASQRPDTFRVSRSATSPRGQKRSFQ